MIDSLSVFRYKTTESTNTLARDYIKNGGRLPALFTAKEQTAGRGRRGKSFYSPKDSGLYMSLAIPYSRENNVSLTCAVSVALLRVLSDKTDKALQIKWVNDLLADGKKVAGILTEAVTDPKSGKITAVIIGVGVNITTASFPDELCDIAGSLGKKSIDNEALSLDIASGILKILSEQNITIMEEYRRHSAVLGRDIYYIKNGLRYDARVLEILSDGALRVLKTDNEEDILSSGEISLRIK